MKNIAELVVPALVAAVVASALACTARRPGNAAATAAVGTAVGGILLGFLLGEAGAFGTNRGGGGWYSIPKGVEIALAQVFISPCVGAAAGAVCWAIVGRRNRPPNG
jgi:hypothetical protein